MKHSADSRAGKGRESVEPTTGHAPSVSRMMTRLVMTTTPETRLEHAAHVLREWHVSGLPVVEEGHVVGVVSEKDIVRDLHRMAGIGHPRGVLDLLLESSTRKGENMLAVCRRRLRNGRVREVMSKPAVTVREDASLLEAARLMKTKGLGRLPVVDGQDRLVGIVAPSDLDRDLANIPTRARGALHPRPPRPRSRRGPSDAEIDL